MNVLLKTVLIIGVPTLVGILVGIVVNSYIAVALGIIIGLIAFVWIGFNKLRHFGRVILRKINNNYNEPLN